MKARSLNAKRQLDIQGSRRYHSTLPAPQIPMGSRGWSEMTNAAMEDFTRWCERKLAKSADQLEAIEGGQFNVVPRTSR
jgi:hypothetical protein